MKNENFIMLPNNLIWNYKNSNDTMYNMFGDKLPYVSLLLCPILRTYFVCIFGLYT